MARKGIIMYRPKIIGRPARIRFLCLQGILFCTVNKVSGVIFRPGKLITSCYTIFYRYYTIYATTDRKGIRARVNLSPGHACMHAIKLIIAT